MRHDDLLRNSRQLKQRRIFRQWLWFASSLTALLVIVIIMANTSRFAIGEIKVVGTQTIRVQDIQSTIDEVLAGRYGGIFSRRNVWLFPKTAVVQALRSQYPNLASVRVALTDKTTLTAEVAERAGTVRWCRDESEQVCYFADQNGYIFSESPEFSHGIFLSIVSNLPTDPIDLAPLETVDFKKLLALRSALTEALSASSKSPVKIFQIRHEEGRDYAMMAENESLTQHYRVRVSLDQDVDQAATNAAAALAAPALTTELAKKESTLDYLDLRFAPKIFYKFQPGI